MFVFRNNSWGNNIATCFSLIQENTTEKAISEIHNLSPNHSSYFWEITEEEAIEFLNKGELKRPKTALITTNKNEGIFETQSNWSQIQENLWEVQNPSFAYFRFTDD